MTLGKEDIGDAEDVKDFFVDPNLISIAKSSGTAAVDKKVPPQNKRLLHQVMDKLGATLTSTRQATNGIYLNDFLTRMHIRIHIYSCLLHCKYIQCNFYSF